MRSLHRTPVHIQNNSNTTYIQQLTIVFGYVDLYMRV